MADKTPKHEENHGRPGPDPVPEPETVHLHKNHNETYCGEDASYLDMTSEMKEVTCDECVDAVKKTHKELKKLNEEAQELNEEVAKNSAKFAEDRKNLENAYEVSIGKLGERATELTERRKAFTDSHPNLPELPE